MNYLEWNDAIAESLFNSSNAGKETYLYLTKDDIIRIGKNNSPPSDSETIWNNFTRMIVKGMPKSSAFPTIVDKAIHSYNRWRIHDRFEEEKLIYPPYIGYLIFLILPLLDANDNYNSNNYYDRLTDLLAENNITQNLKNRLKEIEPLWGDLSNWANIKHNGESGFFHHRNFSHPNWIYVGKLFSQCMFPPKAKKKLPLFFLQAGMVPDSVYSFSELKKNLLQYSSSIFHLRENVIETIRRSDSNELGQSIIELVDREYQKWTGESHVFDEELARSKRNYISSRIYLQFQPFITSGKIEFSYRLHSSNEFPEDLNFDGETIVEEKGGYSRSIKMPFKNTFELRDDFNKWIAKFSDNEVRLFMSASLLQMSNDYWFETDRISKTAWMYCLCKESVKEKINVWLKESCISYEDRSYLKGLPDGYSLYKFIGPREGLSGVPRLTVIKEKRIRLNSSLQVDFRTFTDDFLPEIEIINSDGTENVYFQYKDTKEKHYLDKPNNNNYWVLPSTIARYVDFNIYCEDEEIEGTQTTYRILCTHDLMPNLDENELPRRDSFGRITDDSTAKYCLGSNTIGTNLLRQLPYTHIFKGINPDVYSALEDPIYNACPGEILLSFLSHKGRIHVEGFYKAFELLHYKFIGNQNGDLELNYSKIKKASLSFFDFLGYLDYEYDTKQIVVNPPQFVFVPTDIGRKVLLIGGRNSFLVRRLIKLAPSYQLKVEITEQFESNKHMLLPNAIFVRSFGGASINFGENNIIQLAEEMGIKFNPNELIQVSLQQFCSGIEDYEKEIFENKDTGNDFEDWDWAQYVFNPESLRLEQSKEEDFNKNFSLIEYKLRPWEFHHRLWVDEKCYAVDRNWGQFVVLKHYKKQAILKGNDKVAIPTTLPLPRLLAESILLCSGVAPTTRLIDNIRYRVYENIPSTFINNLFRQLGQQPLIYQSL